MKRYGLKKRLSYRFDNWMSRGTAAMVGLLSIATVIVVIVTGCLSALVNGEGGEGVPGSIWVSLMHAIDAGTLTADAGNIWFMILMTIVTLCGLLITSVLIGIVNSGMESKMEELRKGKSDVLESGHTVILGFNDGIFTILNELIEANSNQKDGVVVIMDSVMGKEEMEDAVHSRIPNTRTTRIIFRNGNIASFADLSVCAVDSCKSVIINTDDDFITIKSILAVTNLLKKSENKKAYLTAVVREEHNLAAAKIAGEDYAEIFYFKDTISRIIANTLYQSGLSAVFTELFDYDGDELYIEEIPEMVGKTMADANLYFPISTAIGIKKRDKILLNAPVDTLIEKGDKLILFAADDGVSIPTAEPAKYDSSVFADSGAPENEARRILILGYDQKLRLILSAEDECMSKGSEIIIGIPDEYSGDAQELSSATYNNISVKIKACDIYNIDELVKMLDEKPSAVLVLSNQDIPAEQEDAKTLLLLLQLRRYAEENHAQFSVTSEMQNIENQELAQITEVNDFVISSNITNLMVTQVSQTRELNAIFSELLTAEGSEIHIKPVCNYVKTGVEMDMYTVCMAAVKRSEVCIGYRKAGESCMDFSIITNPAKDSRIKFGEKDCLIVISEE